MKKCGAYINGLLFTHKGEKNYVICRKMDVTGSYGYVR
jgi:hypothetical protein